MPSNSAGPSNLLLNKTNPQRYYPQPKISINGTTKYLNKPTANNFLKTNPNRNFSDKIPRLMYSNQKNPYKTSIPPGYATKAKNLSPQGKSIPGQVQRNSAGLRTIPPQRPLKASNKTNYIGKHAVQAQKLKAPHVPNKMRNLKHISSPTNAYHNRLPQSSQVTFNQALTAQILETLGQDSSKNCFESNRYDNFSYMENNTPM